MLVERQSGGHRFHGPGPDHGRNPMTTARGYRAVAAALAATKEDAREVLRSYFILRMATGRIADVFEQDNPRFDRERFLTACGFVEAKS